LNGSGKERLACKSRWTWSARGQGRRPRITVL